MSRMTSPHTDADESTAETDAATDRATDSGTPATDAAVDAARTDPAADTVLDLDGVAKAYSTESAVEALSMSVVDGEILALLGPSGCGKTTTLRLIAGLERSDAGTIDLDGRTLADAAAGVFVPPEEHNIGLVFQDFALFPHLTAAENVGFGLSDRSASDRDERVAELLDLVGLTDHADHYPEELSGGQKQRIALARALVLNPELIVADEPVSALDVSIQAEILSLIADLQEEFGLSMLFISHDMSVIREVCDRVAVMYLGEIVETGDTETVFTDPQHPYTEALLSSIPTPDPRSRGDGIELTGTVPDPVNPPNGCRFHTRCHRVVQPDDIDVEQSTWRGLIDLRYRARDDDIDVDRLMENALAEEAAAGREPTDEEIRAQIRREFDLPERLTDPGAESTLAEALELLVDGEVESAATLLDSEFVTPCERTHPEFTDHGDGHQSACIRHRAEVDSFEAAADDD